MLEDTQWLHCNLGGPEPKDLALRSSARVKNGVRYDEINT